MLTSLIVESVLALNSLKIVPLLDVSLTCLILEDDTDQYRIICLLLFEGTFTSCFKDKKSKRSQKTVGIKGFLTLFA